MELFERVGACFDDFRRPALIVHDCRCLAGKRVPGILLGHEDLSGHDELRRDPAFGAILGRLEPRRAGCAPLAGKSALNRFELSAAGVSAGKARKAAAGFGKLDQVKADLFVEKHPLPPVETVIDPDATGFMLHGGQEHRFHHGYCDHHCYPPPLCFCGRYLVMVRLCAAGGDPAAGVEDGLEALTRQIRARWPGARGAAPR